MQNRNKRWNNKWEIWVLRKSTRNEALEAIQRCWERNAVVPVANLQSRALNDNCVIAAIETLFSIAFLHFCTSIEDWKDIQRYLRDILPFKGNLSEEVNSETRWTFRQSAAFLPRRHKGEAATADIQNKTQTLKTISNRNSIKILANTR